MIKININKSLLQNLNSQLQSIKSTITNKLTIQNASQNQIKNMNCFKANLVTKIKDFDKRIAIWDDVKKSNDSSSSCGGSYVNGYQKYLRNKLQEL